jgi:acetyl-CoA carboxylase biotin carboxyl carrier protein
MKKSGNRTPKPGGRTVPDDGPKPPSPFDVRTIKELVALMSRHDLSEIDLSDGALRIRLRRGARAGAAAPPPVAAVPADAGPPPPVLTVPAPKPAEEARPTRNLVEIKSPTPGTFYAASGPDAEPFVRVGSRVTPTTVVCLIEAMKIFNEINAECSGVIAEILVENQQAVEYGQVLFRVDPAG